MVTEKAAEKRKVLTDQLEHTRNVANDDYKRRLEEARMKLEQLSVKIEQTIHDIFRRFGLEYGLRYGCRKHSFEDMFDDGNLRRNLDEYIIDDSKKQNTKIDSLKEDIEALDKAVSKKKQEILLRASLGMKYDEIVSIINGFKF
jgi:hypothetical protein